jgi:uncharacterized membrane protein YfcA
VGVPDFVLLGGAGFLAGAVNAVAGGGSLISFPALLAAGYPSVTANVTNAVAVVPGYLGGSIGYRRELEGQGGRIRSLGAVSAVGAVTGAALLLVTPGALFEELAPFLILFSCLLLALQPWLARKGVGAGRHRLGPLPLQFGAAVYGGYFGAGVGIMMLAILGLFLDDPLHRLNALKGLLSLIVGLVSAAFFAFFGPVAWGAAAGMAVASLAGGHVGVGLARRLDAARLRAGVVAFGVFVAVVLLLR